ATKTISAPIDRVFGFVSDHERFLTGAGLTCTMGHAGRDDPNGEGAVRLVRSGPLLFREVITSFEPDTRYEYVIRMLRGPLGVRMPVTHELGWVELTPHGDLTDVVWGSRFEIDLPFGTRFVGGRLAETLEAGWGRVLERARRELET
ncbi:MAG: SRPBCC family protein, partial [Myxococcota bacterium]